MNLANLSGNAYYYGYVFKVGGVDISVSFWVIILVMLLAYDAKHYIKKQMQNNSFGRTEPNKLLLAVIIAAALIIFSLACHEIAHALVAKIYGISIVKAGVSWWGAYVSTNLKMDEMSPWAEIMICSAGPACNFLIAGLAAIPVWIYGESVSENTLQYVSYINIRLAKLNLIPIMVLDGGRMLHGTLRFFLPPDLCNWIMPGVSVIVILAYSYYGYKSENTSLTLERRLEQL
jgi:Zn-dependent protease